MVFTTSFSSFWEQLPCSSVSNVCFLLISQPQPDPLEWICSHQRSKAATLLQAGLTGLLIPLTMGFTKKFDRHGICLKINVQFAISQGNFFFLLKAIASEYIIVTSSTWFPNWNYFSFSFQLQFSLHQSLSYMAPTFWSQFKNPLFISLFQESGLHT